MKKEQRVLIRGGGSGYDCGTQYVDDKGRVWWKEYNTPVYENSEHDCISREKVLNVMKRKQLGNTEFDGKTKCEIAILEKSNEFENSLPGGGGGYYKKPMDIQDFKIMAHDITAKLKGKTISNATAHEWGMGCSIKLYFTDDTFIEIHPEHDEGFVFDFD